ncbi:MAG: hypothetical protein K2Y23_09975 [Cyanobacteria bacterium]|nr:hypothetical protein [Cyanobacteriota bacterium]
MTALAALAGLGVVATVWGHSLVILVSHALVPISPLMFFVGIAVGATGHARLWFLYLCAPPATLVGVLSGIGVVLPAARALSWLIGAPLLIGMLLSSACAVWVFNRARTITREHSRQRSPGPLSDLPVLRWQNRARMVRLTAASSCALLAIAGLTLVRPIGLGVVIAVALLVGGLACLRFEAAVMCWVRRPLVVFEDQSARATYAGRWALSAPITSLLSLMTNEQCAARSSVALMALLRDGSLGPIVRSASSRLTLDQTQRLTLSLSLQPGGAGAIRYLSPAFPEQMRPIASTYARLAEEAVIPPDLQRWLAALTDHSGIATLAETGLAPELAQTLSDARDALLDSSYSPTITHAVTGLQHTIVALYGTIGRTPESGSEANWPDVLLARIAAHARLLGALRMAGSETELTQ